MKGPASSLEFRLEVDLPISEAFRFFSDVPTLNAVTPPWFRLDPTGVPPKALGVGTRIDYRFRWRALPLLWRSRITDWRPPHLFAYEQERGPYRLFRHEHIFEPRAGGTLVTDRVLYRTLGGRLIGRTLVEPELRRIFAYRAAEARRLIPATLGDRCA